MAERYQKGEELFIVYYRGKRSVIPRIYDCRVNRVTRRGMWIYFYGLQHGGRAETTYYELHSDGKYYESGCEIPAKFLRVDPELQAMFAPPPPGAVVVVAGNAAPQAAAANADAVELQVSNNGGENANNMAAANSGNSSADGGTHGAGSVAAGGTANAGTWGSGEDGFIDSANVSQVVYTPVALGPVAAGVTGAEPHAILRSAFAVWRRRSSVNGCGASSTIDSAPVHGSIGASAASSSGSLPNDQVASVGSVNQAKRPASIEEERNGLKRGRF